MNPIIIIPARLASTRLPDKPLAIIAGEPMIAHVWRRAMAAQAGEVVVACDGKAIADAITKIGGRAIITDPHLPSGSDRIYQALQAIDPEKKYDVIVNVQGDMPTLDPMIITEAVELLRKPIVDIGTLAAVITDEKEKTDPAVVKAIIASDGRAINFTRASTPSTDGRFLHHIGIYAYRREGLEKFVALPPSPLELREKLEQLRAMEAGMRIDVAIVSAVPLGVDTPETLKKAREYYEQKNR
jgi:3-deoxy-manno-octulosonate cytidylyltransferase (CMP-KDO synthetase)